MNNYKLERKSKKKVAQKKTVFFVRPFVAFSFQIRIIHEYLIVKVLVNKSISDNFQELTILLLQQ